MANDSLANIAPWFAEASPGLLTNRTVRNFISHYSQSQWPEVIKLVLIHGIIALHKQHPGQHLSVKQLKELIEKGGCSLVIERSIPQLQRQILQLQTELDGVFDSLAVEPTSQASVLRAGEKMCDNWACHCPCGHMTHQHVMQPVAWLLMTEHHSCHLVQNCSLSRKHVLCVHQVTNALPLPLTNSSQQPVMLAPRQSNQKQHAVSFSTPQLAGMAILGTSIPCTAQAAAMLAVCQFNILALVLPCCLVC